MLISGEKYACEACVRGHRVSNCQHSGKSLLLLPTTPGLSCPYSSVFVSFAGCC